MEFDTRKERDTHYVVTERSELMNRIQDLIDNLPQRQREVMQLRDIEGYSYKEIAENLDIDINLVKTNLFRARRKIKESLIKSLQQIHILNNSCLHLVYSICGIGYIY